MKKHQLINLTRAYIAGTSPKDRGKFSFLSFFIEFLAEMNIPADLDHEHWRIEPYLSKIIVAAHEQFRIGQDEKSKRWRAQYEKDTGWAVPHLTDVGNGSITHHALEVDSIARSFSEIAGDGSYSEMRRSIEAYCNTQYTLVQQTFDVFARHVYWEGLFEVIRDCKSSGMQGKFGQTTLRSFISAGRIMFTFCRKKDDSEIQVSFIAEDGDPRLFNAGMRSADADVHLCTEMIMDVVKHWPFESTLRRKAFVSDTDVTLDAVAAARTTVVQV